MNSHSTEISVLIVLGVWVLVNLAVIWFIRGATKSGDENGKV